MNQARIRDFSAAILVDSSGRLLLQRRDNKPGIAQPGKVSFFGGGREEGESALDCIVREIAEEIGIVIQAEHFEHLVSLDIPDPENSCAHVKGEYFVAQAIETSRLHVTEGALLMADIQELDVIRSELTPLTAIVLDRFLGQSVRSAMGSAKKILFLCTGNYYRSRFAEELFNHCAERECLQWRAFSRGLAEASSPDNVGPISRFALERLHAIGVSPTRTNEFPQSCSLADFADAEVVIALKEAEHRSIVERRFPTVASCVQYWEIDDIDVAEPRDALPALERSVKNLIRDLRFMPS